MKKSYRNLFVRWSQLAIITIGLFAIGPQATVQGSDQIPGAPQKKPVVIKNAVLHTIVGKTISNGIIVIQNGKISELGEQVSIPENAEVIDAKGGHVYPGLIDAQSNVGLTEIDSIRPTIDVSETGLLNPNVRSAAAFNPDSELIPVARANGVLLAVSAPEGGLVSGRSSLMMMDGWTWEDMTLKADLGMQVNWPRQFTFAREGRFGGAGGSGGADIKALESLFESTTRYKIGLEAGTVKFDAKLKAMIPVLNREMPLVVNASTAVQIRSAIAFAKKWNVRLILFGGFEALECKELILAEKIPIIVGGVYRTPNRRDLPYDDAYTLPSRLKAAGIPFCIASAGRFGASGLRNLPYNAATAAAYGLDPFEALRSITLSPAEILGVADRVGSLAPGLDGTLFVADGDILETPTQVTSAFIQGRKVDLSSKHTQLYQKYSKKYDQLKSE